MLTVQLIVSFIAGGLLIALQTLIAERVRSDWKGIILTIPTTLALGLFFIGAVKSPADVPEAAAVVPVVLGADYIFTAVFALLIPYGLATGLVASFAAWIVCAYAILRFPPSSFLVSSIIGMLTVYFAYTSVKDLPAETKLARFPMNAYHITIRSIIGGTIVALIVLLSRTLGNIWGGLFSAFPAAFTSTFIIYYYTQGKAVIPAVARSLFFPGSIGFIVYAGTATVAIPRYGIWVGTLLAYAATIIFFWGWRMGNIRRKRN